MGAVSLRLGQAFLGYYEFVPQIKSSATSTHLPPVAAESAGYQG